MFSNHFILAKFCYGIIWTGTPASKGIKPRFTIIHGVTPTEGDVHGVLIANLGL